MRSLALVALLALPAIAQVTITDNDGKTTKGRDVLISDSGEITLLTDGAPITTKMDGVSEISWGNARPIATGGEWEIQLDNANPRCRDLISGAIADPSDNEHVRVTGTDAGDVEFPIEYMYALSNVKAGLPVPEIPPQEDTLTWSKDQKRDTDKGTLTRIGKDEIVLQSSTFNNERTYKLANVEGLHMLPIHKASPPQGVLVVVTTKKNMRITGRIVEMTAKVCRVETTHRQKGKAFELPIQADKVASIQIMNGNLAYLSDMNPTLVDGWREQITDVDAKMSKDGWFFLDRKVTRNEPITIRSNPFRKGISTKKRVEIAVNLGGAYSKFTATVGLADDAVPNTLVDPKLAFVVKGDGKELWRSEVLNFDSKPQPVSLDVKGVKTLSLLTETFDEVDMLEFGAWGDARVVK